MIRFQKLKTNDSISKIENKHIQYKYKMESQSDDIFDLLLLPKDIIKQIAAFVHKSAVSDFAMSCKDAALAVRAVYVHKMTRVSSVENSFAFSKKSLNRVKRYKEEFAVYVHYVKNTFNKSSPKRPNAAMIDSTLTKIAEGRGEVLYIDLSYFENVTKIEMRPEVRNKYNPHIAKIYVGLPPKCVKIIIDRDLSSYKFTLLPAFGGDGVSIIRKIRSGGCIYISERISITDTIKVPHLLYGGTHLSLGSIDQPFPKVKSICTEYTISNHQIMEQINNGALEKLELNTKGGIIGFNLYCPKLRRLVINSTFADETDKNNILGMGKRPAVKILKEYAFNTLIYSAGVLFRMYMDLPNLSVIYIEDRDISDVAEIMITEIIVNLEKLDYILIYPRIADPKHADIIVRTFPPKGVYVLCGDVYVGPSIRNAEDRISIFLKILKANDRLKHGYTDADIIIDFEEYKMRDFVDRRKIAAFFRDNEQIDAAQVRDYFRLFKQ